MEIIKISSRKKPVSKGLYGQYFRISKYRGVKVIGKGYKNLISIFTRFKALHNTELEVKLLKKAERSKISPKGAKAVVVEYKRKFYPAIKMEHIVGETLYNFDSRKDLHNLYVDRNGKLTYKKTSTSVGSFVRKKLKKAGIINRDLHLNNVMVSKGRKVRAIDFSPEQIRLIKNS